MRRLTLLVLFLATAPLRAQDQPPPWAAAVDTAIQAEIDRQGLINAAVVVISDGKIAWSKGYGWEDREAKIPVDPAQTQFRWASISKSITAIAALQLAEQGKLDLDADVRQYVPEFPDKGVKITARQLLCHQSGIVHYTNGVVIRAAKAYDTPHPYTDVITALDTFKPSPLLHAPGAKFSYSTHAYILLSAVVERAGKQPFVDQVNERIRVPLGMSQFQPDYQWEPIPHRAAGYRKAGEAIERRAAEDDADVSWKLGGGGYTSTPMDLAAFGVGLINRKLVSEATETLMWTAQKPADLKGARSYGLGFFVQENRGGHRRVGHNGSQDKARTALLLEPTARRGVAVMTSCEWAEPVNIATKVINLLPEP